MIHVIFAYTQYFGIFGLLFHLDFYWSCKDFFRLNQWSMARYESIYIMGKYPMPIRDTLFNQNKIENPTAEVTRPCDPLYGQQKIKVFLWFHIKLSEQQNKGMH